MRSSTRPQLRSTLELVLAVVIISEGDLPTDGALVAKDGDDASAAHATRTLAVISQC